MIPVNMDPESSTPFLLSKNFTPETIPSFTELISSGPLKSSDDTGTESSVDLMDPMDPGTIANAQTDPDYSLTLCNSVSTTTGRKLRRQQGGACLPGRTRINQSPYPLVDPSGDTTTSGSDQDTDSKQPLTPEEERRNDDISRRDKMWMNERTEDQRIYVTKPSKEDQECRKNDPKRPKALCCVGPPSLQRWLPKRDTTAGDIENCLPEILGRPFCAEAADLNLPIYYCCARLDLRFWNRWGWLGRNCKQML